MVPRLAAVLNLFCVLSVCVTPSKSLPQRKEISQREDKCDHCGDLIKADASDLDVLRSPKQSSEPDLTSKNILESTKKEDTKRVEESLLEDCKFNCTKSMETPDEAVRKIPRFASAEEKEEFGKIRAPRTAVGKSFAADSDPKMRSKGKPGGFNGRSLSIEPPQIGDGALTGLENKTSSADKPANETVTVSSIKVTPSSKEGVPSTTKITPSSTKGISATTATPSSTKGIPITAATQSSTEGITTTTVTPSSTEGSTTTTVTPSSIEGITTTTVTPSSTEGSTTTTVTPSSTEGSTTTTVTPSSTEGSTTTTVTPSSTEGSTTTTVTPSSTEGSTTTTVTPSSTEGSTTTTVTPSSTEGITTTTVTPSSTEGSTTTTVTPSSTEGSTTTTVTSSSTEGSTTTTVTPSSTEGSTTTTVTPSSTEGSTTTTVTPTSAEATKITGTELNGAETTTFSAISTTAEVNSTPVTMTTEPPEHPTENEEEQDLVADFIDVIIEQLEKIQSDENTAVQTGIVEQEVNDFFKCLMQYADLQMVKPLREECGNSMNNQLFVDLMNYINPSTEPDFYGSDDIYGDLDDIYGDLDDIPLRSGFGSRNNGTRKADNDAENASNDQNTLPIIPIPVIPPVSEPNEKIKCMVVTTPLRREFPQERWRELDLHMGSLPALSILKGPKRPLTNGCEPIALHNIFESMVSAVEKIAAINNNQIETIHSIEINESVAQQTALISETGVTTFSDLNSAANKLGWAILKNLRGDVQLGNDDGDVLIAVCIKPSEELVTTLLAIWKIGAAYLPLDAAFPKNRIKHILDESRPVMVIVDDFDIGDEFSTVKYSELTKMGMNMPEYNIPEEDTLTKNIPRQALLAAVLYTSGSTGVPKGVRIPHSAILNRLKWQWRTFPYSSTEKVCVFKTALTFVDSVCELWGPLLNARSVVILSKEDTKNPEKLTTILEKYEIERLILVPTLLQSILLYASIKKSNDFLPKLRLWVCSGETLSVSLARNFYDCFDSSKHSLCNFYGSTEVMGDVTYHVIAGGEELERAEKVPIGKPLENCTIYILDKDHRPVNMNEVGELYVSGMNLASGYVRGRDPEKFLDNPLAVDPGHLKLYKTGDFARVVKNTVHYEGRADSQIKVRGHRVDLSEIELAVAKMTEIDKYVVLTYNPGEVNQAILTFVTVRTNTTAKVIEEYLSTVLAPYMVPQVIVVDHFPLLVNGKVDRQYFLKKYKEEYNSEANSTTVPEIDYAGVPLDKMEKAKALFETTLSVLGRSLRSSITTNSNFYHLGGNSLNSVYTVTKLRDLGYIISIGDFISALTLLDVINKMEEERPDTMAEELDTLNQKYRSELLSNKHKSHVYNIITSSFYEKADLESHLVPPVPMSDYIELMDALWPHLLEKNLSFVAIDSNDDIKGAALNFDAHDEPDITIGDSNRLNVIFEFLEFLEGPIRDEKLPKGKNKILHSFMMGTRTDLKPQESIEIIYFMEEEVLKLAEKRNYFGVLTSNTNALTQQLGCDVNKYESLLDYQVNKYVASDGSKPFGKAPDSQRTIVSWKTVRDQGLEY